MRAVVIAGGESSRMGREKALMQYLDRALIEYSLDAVAGLGDPPLVVSNNPEVRNYLRDIEVIPDFLLGRGPLGGIHAALEHTRSDIIIVACDAPLLVNNVVTRLVKARGEADIAVYVSEGKIYPFPGVYGLALLPSIEKRLEGAGRELSLQDMIRSTPAVRYVEIEDGVDALVGINTPDDYKRITGRDLT